MTTFNVKIDHVLTAILENKNLVYLQWQGSYEIRNNSNFRNLKEVSRYELWLLRYCEFSGSYLKETSILGLGMKGLIWSGLLYSIFGYVIGLLHMTY